MEAEHSLEQVLRWERRQVPWERVAVLFLLTVGAARSYNLASVWWCFAVLVVLAAEVGHSAGFILPRLISRCSESCIEITFTLPLCTTPDSRRGCQAQHACCAPHHRASDISCLGTADEHPLLFCNVES